MCMWTISTLVMPQLCSTVLESVALGKKAAGFLLPFVLNPVADWERTPCLFSYWGRCYRIICPHPVNLTHSVYCCQLPGASLLPGVSVCLTQLFICPLAPHDTGSAYQENGYQNCPNFIQEMTLESWVQAPVIGWGILRRVHFSVSLRD